MTAFDTLTAHNARVNDLIADFIRNWITPLDKLAQEIFFHRRFKVSLASGSVEHFLRDRRIVEDCLDRVELKERIVLPPNVKYPVLYVLFMPLFDALLMKSTDMLWGGINYWDTLANTFYTEQFTRLEKSPDDAPIFRKAMSWGLDEASSHVLLPLTTFVFEKCKPPRQAGVFAKNETFDNRPDPSSACFYDLRGSVRIDALKGKDGIRHAIANSDDETTVAKILENYFSSHRPRISVTYPPDETINLEREKEQQFNNLFEFFELITPDPGWNKLYYISARLRPNAKVAGLLLTAEHDIDQTLITFIQFFISRISSFIEYVISSYEMRRHAIRSALAAIMGRNMSHNIGSHVLARISTPQTMSEAVFDTHFLDEVKPFVKETQAPLSLDMLLGESPDETHAAHNQVAQIKVETVKTQFEASATFVAQLNAYLRMRMDFVADIATALRPPSPMRVSFLGEVLLPFAGQWLLWKNLCGSQNVTQEDITFTVTAEGATTSVEAGTQDYHGHLDTRLASIAVGIPNGALGCQAFYSIVENFVRNTVKHSKAKEKRRLQIFFDFVLDGDDPLFDDFFKITIRDNWGACGSEPSLVSNLNSLLGQPLIKENGSLDSSNRGLKEMKAAACYLRGLLPEALEDPSLSPLLLKAVADADGNLGYEFYMLKPKELFVLDCGQNTTDNPALTLSSETLKALKKQGVAVAKPKKASRNSLEKASAYSILFIINAENSDLNALSLNPTELPIRLLIQRRHHVEAIYGSYKRKLPLRHIGTLFERFLTSLKEGHGVEAATDVRELWMRMVCHEPQTQLWIDALVRDDEWNVEGLSRMAEKEDKPEAGSQVILYARHGFQNRDDNVAFYEPYAGGGIDPISFVLENPPKTLEGRRSLVYQLIETGALPVIILDERIQEAAETVSRSFSSDQNEGKPENMIYWLRLMRVHVPEKSRLDLESEALTPEQIGDWLKSTVSQCQVGCRIPPLVVIHQGILDGIGLRDGNEAQRWIDGLKSKGDVSEVIVTSGRGTPDNIAPRTRFVPLSTVSLYTVERKSKFHLVKALLAARIARAGGRKQ